MSKTSLFRNRTTSAATVRRSTGGMAAMIKESVERARSSGILPHEALLQLGRGEGITITKTVPTLDAYGNETGSRLVKETQYPTLDMAVACLIAAAPYYAPKQAVMAVDVTTTVDVQELSDAELTERLRDLAARYDGRLTLDPWAGSTIDAPALLVDGGSDD